MCVAVFLFLEEECALCAPSWEGGSMRNLYVDSLQTLPVLCFSSDPAMYPYFILVILAVREYRLSPMSHSSESANVVLGTLEVYLFGICNCLLVLHH